MGQHETGGGAGKHFYVKVKHLKASDQEFPCLELKWKDGTGYATKNVGALSGFITSIEKVDKEEMVNNKKKRFRGVKFTMQDFDVQENYHFELLYSGPVRELLSRMCSLDNFLTPLKISFYRGDKGFPGASLKKKLNGAEEKVELKYKYDQLIKPLVRVVQFNGEDQKDYTLVDDKFDSMITNLLAKYEKQEAETPRYDTNYTPPETNQNNITNGGGSSDQSWPDDLPFRFNDKPLKF